MIHTPDWSSPTGKAAPGHLVPSLFSGACTAGTAVVPGTEQKQTAARTRRSPFFSDSSVFIVTSPLPGFPSFCKHCLPRKGSSSLIHPVLGHLRRRHPQQSVSPSNKTPAAPLDLQTHIRHANALCLLASIPSIPHSPSLSLNRDAVGCRPSASPVTTASAPNQSPSPVVPLATATVHSHAPAFAGAARLIGLPSCSGSPVEASRGDCAMPSRLNTAVLSVDPTKIHEVDTRNMENLHGMWIGECDDGIWLVSPRADQQSFPSAPTTWTRAAALRT